MSILKWSLIFCLFVYFLSIFVAELATGITGQKKEIAKTLIRVPPPKKKPKK